MQKAYLLMNYSQPIPQKFMVMEDDMGVNAPLIHQQVISRLHVGLGILFYRDKSIVYEPLTETMLDEESSPTSDLILYDVNSHSTKIIIEVCGLRGEKNDLKKVVNLIEDTEYGIFEGFVFNYNTHTWLRYRKGDGGQATESSFSEVLKLDLSLFLI